MQLNIPNPNRGGPYDLALMTMSVHNEILAMHSSPRGLETCAYDDACWHVWIQVLLALSSLCTPQDTWWIKRDHDPCSRVLASV